MQIEYKKYSYYLLSGGEQSAVEYFYRDEDSSNSSFSSASRASPTPSYGDTFLHFPGDSSGSV